MKKKIYMFTLRDGKPDLYINIIGSYIEKFGDNTIEDIFLLKIINEEDQNQKSQEGDKSSIEQLDFIRENISKQVSCLIDSSYLEWKRDSSYGSFINIEAPKRIEINGQFLEIYEKIKKKINYYQIGIKTITDTELEKKLIQTINNPSFDFIFDLTALDKDWFLKVSLILLSRNCSIYYFDTLKTFTRDEKDMIHYLLYLNENIGKSFRHTILNPENYKVIKTENDKLFSTKVKTWKAKLGNSEFDVVVHQLRAFIEEREDIRNKFEDDVIRISSEFSKLKKERRLGSTDGQLLEQKASKVLSSILSIIKEIEEFFKEKHGS